MYRIKETKVVSKKQFTPKTHRLEKRLIREVRQEREENKSLISLTRFTGVWSKSADLIWGSLKGGMGSPAGRKQAGFLSSSGAFPFVPMIPSGHPASRGHLSDPIFSSCPSCPSCSSWLINGLSALVCGWFFSAFLAFLAMLYAPCWFSKLHFCVICYHPPHKCQKGTGPWRRLKKLPIYMKLPKAWAEL